MSAVTLTTAWLPTYLGFSYLQIQFVLKRNLSHPCEHKQLRWQRHPHPFQWLWRHPNTSKPPVIHGALLDLHQGSIATKYYNFATCVIVLYDHLLTLDVEVANVWKQSWSLPKLLWFVVSQNIFQSCICQFIKVSSSDILPPSHWLAQYVPPLLSMKLTHRSV